MVAKERSRPKVLSSEIRDDARGHMPSHELQVCRVWLDNSIFFPKRGAHYLHGQARDQRHDGTNPNSSTAEFRGLERES
jgi:hypothetical protein